MRYMTYGVDEVCEEDMGMTREVCERDMGITREVREI